MPEISASLEMRERYSAGLKSANPIILIDSIGVHHIRTEWSTVAWRDASGLWQINQVGEDGPGGLLKIERTLSGKEARTLSTKEGRALDKLLATRAVYTESLRWTGQIGVGAASHVMEIRSSTGQTVVRWDGRLRGRAGRVADLILGVEKD